MDQPVISAIYPFQRPLVEAVFLERPNRFVAYVDIQGHRERVQVPDPGRLKELLIPGTPVMLEDFGNAPQRKTRYAMALVRSPDQRCWVSLNTHLPNQLVKYWLSHRLIPPLSNHDITKAEFTYGQSRFDFLLTCTLTGKKRIVEVKSVTLVDDETALFPDAPTKRGARHIRELIAAQNQDRYEVGVLFVIQRPDAKRVVPNRQTDPDFALAVEEALSAGVSFWALGCEMTLDGVRLLPTLLPVELQQ